MKYIRLLQKIEGEILKNMNKVSQKTIDFVQETTMDLDRDLDEYPIRRDELGSIRWEIDTLLEIWDPALEYDIQILARFESVLKDWYEDVEFRNRALGIAPEDG